MRNRSVCLALIACLSVACLSAASLDKVWQVDLRTALGTEKLGPRLSLKVTGLQFSPDGQQIAVLVRGNSLFFHIQDPKVLVIRLPLRLI